MSDATPSSDAKKIPLLAAILALALGAVVYSWKSTQSPVTARTSAPPSAAREMARTLEDVDQLESAVRRHLESSAAVLDLSDWKDRTAPPPPPAPSVQVAKPVVQEMTSAVDLRFKGIARGAITTAFINDAVLEKGESIGGYTLVEIADESVVLQAPSGERITLRMRGLE